MAVSKAKKQEVLSQLIDHAKNAKSIVFADFHGLPVKEMTQLRNKLREQGVYFHVAKKTLIKLAAKEAGYEGELDAKVLEGTVGAAFSMEDEIAAAKLLKEFSKKNKNLNLRGALFEGKVLSVSQTNELASLPSKEELIAKFMYLLKSPVQGFHGVLNNTISGFVRALNAIREKQEQSA